MTILRRSGSGNLRSLLTSLSLPSPGHKRLNIAWASEIGEKGGKQQVLSTPACYVQGDIDGDVSEAALVLSFRRIL